MAFTKLSSFLRLAALALLLSAPAAYAYDPWERQDDAMIACMEQVMPGSSSAMMNPGRSPEESSQYYIDFTQNLDNIQECMQGKGFESTEVKDFDMYMEEAEKRLKENEKANIQPEKLQENSGQQSHGEGKPPKEDKDKDNNKDKSKSPPVYINPNQGKAVPGEKPPLFVPQ